MTSSSTVEGVPARDLPDLVLMAQVTNVVCAYVSNNAIQPSDLPKLIDSVHGALRGAASPAEGQGVAKPTAAEIRKSITHEALISFEDGKPYKTLRRHLTLRGLTPEAYRAKWGLSPDYPMTAQAYSDKRSQLAMSLGLGQQRRKTAPGNA